MKMRVLALAAIAAAVGFTACKKSSKSDDVDSNVELAARVTNHTDDQNNFATQMDAVDNDINSTIESNNAFGREMNVMTPPCNVTVAFDSVAQNGALYRRLTMTFTGNNCQNTHSRTGQIVVTQPMSQHWTDSGAVITENVNNLKITRLSDNKSIVLNGTRTVTNVSGGRLAQLVLGGRSSILHAIAGNMNIRFEDSTSRQWNISRKRLFSRPNTSQMILITVTGGHTLNGVTGVAEWGTNRYGAPFVTRISEPLRMNSECNFRLGSGQIEHTGIGATTTVTFGLDAQGAPTTCPGANPYYFKAVWTNNNGISQTIIRPYY
jgi:hypothetical protein